MTEGCCAVVNCYRGGYIHQMVHAKDGMIDAQQREIAALKERIAQLESLRNDLAALRSALAASVTVQSVANQNGAAGVRPD